MLYNIESPYVKWVALSAARLIAELHCVLCHVVQDVATSTWGGPAVPSPNTLQVLPPPTSNIAG